MDLWRPCGDGAARRLAQGALMSVETADALLDALRESGLLTESQLRELRRAWQGRRSQPSDLTRYLLDQGWLTAFQAEQLIQGCANRLVLGPYRLLDRL